MVRSVTPLISIAAAAWMGLSGMAEAQFVSRYVDWFSLSAESKQAYLAGVVDFLMIWSADQETKDPLYASTRDCINNSKMGTAELATRVDLEYLSSPSELVDVMPVVVLIRSLGRHCPEERAKYGLVPIQ